MNRIKSNQIKSNQVENVKVYTIKELTVCIIVQAILTIVYIAGKDNASLFSSHARCLGISFSSIHCVLVGVSIDNRLSAINASQGNDADEGILTVRDFPIVWVDGGEDTRITMLALSFVESRIANINRKFFVSVGYLISLPVGFEIEVFFSNIDDFFPLLAGITRYLAAGSTAADIDDENVARLGVFRGSYLDGAAVLGCRNL